MASEVARNHARSVLLQVGDARIVGLTLQGLIEEAIDAALNEVVEDSQDQILKDLDACYGFFDEAADQIYEAISDTNLDRLHHLEAVIDYVEDLKTLQRAREIIQELIDPREEVNDSES